MTVPRPWTYDEVMDKLPALVAECLGLEIDEVTPDLVFCSENDSIDLLDLNFHCEKAYGIKSPFRLFLGSKDLLSLDDAGHLTDASMRLIRDNYAFFAAKFDADGRTQWTPNDLLGHFTVEMIARFIVQAAEQQSAGSQAA